MDKIEYILNLMKGKSSEQEKGTKSPENTEIQPSHPVVKVQEEKQKKDVKPTEVEKSEGESSVDRKLYDAKKFLVKMTEDEPSLTINEPTATSFEPGKDATKSEYIKESPSHPVVKLPEEKQKKGSKPTEEEKSEGESSYNAKKFLEKRKEDETSLATNEPPAASSEPEKDATRSKYIKESPSHPVVKLQEKNQEKDSKSTEAEKSEDKSFMNRNLNDLKRIVSNMNEKLTTRNQKLEDTKEIVSKMKESSRTFLMKTLVPPEWEKDSSRSEYINEQTSNPVVKEREEEQEKNSKSTEVEELKDESSREFTSSESFEKARGTADVEKNATTRGTEGTSEVTESVSEDEKGGKEGS